MSFILSIFYNQKPIISKNKPILDDSNYLELVNKKIPTNESLISLENHLLNIKRNYCMNCTNYLNCKKDKTLHLHYLCYLITKNENIKEMPDAIKNIYYNCYHSKEILNYPKIKLNYHAQYKIIEGLKIKEENTSFNSIYQFLLGFDYKILSYNEIKSNNQTKYIIRFNQNISIFFLKHLLKKRYNETYLITKNKDEYLIKPKNTIKVLFDSIVLSKGNKIISGDNILIKKNEGAIYFLLSDGMGSGLKAYEASKDLLETISKLIDKDLNISSILKYTKLKNILKLDNDTFSTLDFLFIDLTKSKALLYKYESSITYLIRGNEIIEYINLELPLKDSKDINPYKIELFKNDLIILMSDGIYEHVDPKLFKDYLMSIKYEDTNKIVYLASKYVYDKSLHHLHDDLSMIALRIIENK